MKTSYKWLGIKFVVGMVALCGLAISAQSTVLIDETFDSGYNRTVNNVGGGNMAVYLSRKNQVTSSTDDTGSLSFSASVNQGADCYRAYFTDPGQNVVGVGNNSQVSNGHLLLGVGDTMIASVSFFYTALPSDVSSAAVRFGLFDDAVGRSMNDLNGGASTSMFTNNPGYGVYFSLATVSTNNGLSIIRRTNLTTTGVFGDTASYATIDNYPGSVGGACPALSGSEELTLKFYVRNRGDANVLTTEMYDTATSTLLEAGEVTDTSLSVTSFSWLAWRTPRMADTASGGPYVFTDMNISVIPEPSTLMLAASGLAMALVAIRRRRS